jgi:hypothetical protein
MNILQIKNESIHMQKSFQNQQLETIKKTASVKRHSDSFDSNKVKKRSMNYENIENEYEAGQVQVEKSIKYVPTRREVDSLVIDNYLFQRVSASTNKDGSVGWRCKEYRTKTKCQSTCRVGPNGDLLRNPGPHNHQSVSDAELVFMKAKADAKKRCRSENNISVQQIFMQEMGKALINSGIDTNSPDLVKALPRFEANKRCLQIQRKIGINQSIKSDNSNPHSGDENSNDAGSLNSASNDHSSNNSVKSDTEYTSSTSVKLPKRKKNLNSIISGLWETRTT